ncbi:MAG: nicotinamide-nucleotide amidohydrolase family protein [Spirochaetaceae bacterium]|nr:MAG: nicotinamide-nucleotide amidohydrolase family protein [Spirochaetaceae bacterium]
MSETASLLCVGSELTEGRTLDRHGRFLAQVFSELGIAVKRIALIPDERDSFRAELTREIADHRLVVVTGGLGPTSDDLSREMISEAVGVPLEFREDLWTELCGRFPGRTIPDANRKQAEIPVGATVLRNIVGTAPGFAVEMTRGAEVTLVVALPGPPKELVAMVDDQLVPLLQRREGLVPGPVTRATAFLIPESELEESLLRNRIGAIEWGTRVEEYRITFVLRGEREADRSAMLSSVIGDFDEYRIQVDEVDLVERCSHRLREAGHVLVTAESCTGGLIAKLITDRAGSSEVFWGATVAYSYEAKQEMLGVSRDSLAHHGAVSAETVEEMARGALALSRGCATIAVSVSGVAGPGGGTEEKPVGTVWIGLFTVDGRLTTRRYRFHGSREAVRKRSAVAALLLIDEALGKLPSLLDSREVLGI